MNTNKNQRKSNLEILRIIAMIFIIAHHWSIHGFSDVSFVISNVNNIPIVFLEILGKIGVDVFILISAYFMVNSKFTIKKFLILTGKVYFYSILFLLIAVFFLTPSVQISTSSIVTSILPISHNAYWFITDYIVLMLLSPVLNRFIKALPKKNIFKAACISIIYLVSISNIHRHQFQIFTYDLVCSIISNWCFYQIAFRY